MPPRGPPPQHPYADGGAPGQPGMHSQPGQQVPFVHNSYSVDPYAQAPYAQQANPYGMPNSQVNVSVNDYFLDQCEIFCQGVIRTQSVLQTAVQATEASSAVLLSCPSLAMIL